MDPVTRGLQGDLKELLREGLITFQQYMEGGRQLREATVSSSTAVPPSESSPSRVRVSTVKGDDANEYILPVLV